MESAEAVRSDMRNTRGWRVAMHALLLLGYFVAGVLAFSVFPIGDSGVGIWPAAGISVAAVLLLGPSAAATVFVADLLASMYFGLPTFVAGLLASAAAAESLLAWWLLTRVVRIDPALARQQDVAAFIALGVLPTALVCVLLRVALMTLAGVPFVLDAAGVQMLVVGVLGHGLGILLVAPVILTRFASRPPRQRRPERVALALAALATNAAAFTVSPLGPGSALLYAVFVVMLWAAVRFGPRETTGVLLLTGAFATWAAAAGQGPFLVSSRIEALYSLSLFLLVAAGTALLVAAAARERAQSLRRVRESERAYRTLIEQMNEGVALLDAHRALEFVSGRFCALVQQTRDALIGKPLASVVAAADRNALNQALDAAAGGGDAACEVRLERDGAAPAIAAVTLRRLADAQDPPTALMVVVADVTEQRRAADLARLRLQQLAHQGRVQSMDEMATAFAHEIAQPLTAVTTYTQAARRFLDARGSSLYPPATLSVLREALDGAESEARRGSEIVRRIRGFVQHRASEKVVQSADLLLDEVARLAAPEARQLEARLEVSLCGSGCRVRVDPVQIQQVVLNLVRNAAEAMAQAGSRERVVVLESRADGRGRIGVSVTDSGPGIPGEDLERIFDAFVTSKPDGVGIGLALCRSIVEEHGGRLWAETPPAGGARFRFTLPEHADE